MDNQTSKKTLRKSSTVLKLSTRIALLMGAIMTLLLMAVALRFDYTWEAHVGTVTLSDRTRSILAETQGYIKISCFMDRRHPMHRPLSRLLRGFRDTSKSVAGADISIEYVDPHWSLARASQLAAHNIPENSVVFERNHRRIVVTLDDMLTKHSRLRDGEEIKSKLNDSRKGSSQELGVFRGEGVCAGAISRLVLPYDRLYVYWTEGHGEARFDNYDPNYGFSDIARELTRCGFALKSFQLATADSIPQECNLLAIVGATRNFADKEIKAIADFLGRGGRLAYFVQPGYETGLEPLIAKWSLRITKNLAFSPRTLTGNDIICYAFEPHAITRDLANSPVLFNHPVCIEPITGDTPESPAARQLVTTGPDGWGESNPSSNPHIFDPSTDVKGPVAPLAISEWGGNAADDLAFKPTRVAAFGETEFMMNGILASRASANRDLVVNTFSWLSGIGGSTASSAGGDATLFIGMDRKRWALFASLSAIFFPAAIFILHWLLLKRKARR